MPRGYYGGGGGTADALFRLSDTLQRGLGGIGQGERQDAEIALARRKTEYDIGRQQKADTRADEVFAMQKPGMELQAQQAKVKQEAYNQPFKLGLGPLGAAVNEDELGHKLAGLAGFTYNPQEKSFYDSGGKVVSQGYMQESGKLPVITEGLLGTLDPESGWDVVIANENKIKSGTLSPEEAGQLQKQNAFVADMYQDPKKYSALLRRLASAATAIGNAEKAKELNARADGLQGQVFKRESEERGYAKSFGLEDKRQAGQIELEKTRQAGAMERAKLKTESPGKGMEEGFWQTPQGEKLDPRSAYTRYLQAVPVQEGLDGVASRDVSFEDWAADNGYYFMPKGGRQPQLGPSGKAAGADSGGGSALVRRAASPQPPPQARQAADGNWYMPDPKRPGKYLRVD